MKQMRTAWVILVMALPAKLTANAEVPEVRFWAPFAGGSQVFSCLQNDLAQWSDAISKELGEPIFPHRLINLPEGRYGDQIRAAIDTGEQPHFLLLEDTARQAATIATNGAVFGADLVGVWVDEGALASLPRALSALADLWTHQAEPSLLALDDLLVLIAGQGTLPLAIDTGAQGLDVGLSMALLIEQWTHVFADPNAPNWQDPALSFVLETLTRWQREGLMEEVDLQALRSSARPMPFLTLARYSSGKEFGPEFVFYPLFSTVPGQRAKFLKLPYQWHVLRPGEDAVIQNIWAEISDGKIFETCALLAGLLSRQQFLDGTRASHQGKDTIDTDAAPPDIYQKLGGFIAQTRQGIPEDLEVGFWHLDTLSIDVPGKLTDTLRDMRAGLSLQNALEALGH